MTAKTQSHTPGNWHIGTGQWHQLLAIYDENCVFVASAHIGYQESNPVCIPSRAEATINAARIVSCVNACTGVEDPSATLASVRAALEDSQKALALVNAFIDDLGKSNPGWIGKLSLQRYDVMNEAYMSLESTPAIVAKALESLPKPQLNP